MRARSFVLAFGVRDVLWSVVFSTAAASLMGFIAEGGPFMDMAYRVYAFAVVIYVPLVAYGILGSAALVFALAPLQRLGERMADAAVPSARATPEYESFRKLQVYEAALLTAYESGHVTDRERRMLASLRESLKIHAAVADRLEMYVGSGAAAA